MKNDSVIKRFRTTLITNILLSLLVFYVLWRLNLGNARVISGISAIISLVLALSFLLIIKKRLQDYPSASFYLYSGLIDFGFRALIVSSILFYFQQKLFYAYDTLFLGVFCIGLGIFLFHDRKKLVKDGIMFLYKTAIGLKLMNYLGGRYQKTMKFMSYIIVTCGYLLMIAAFYMIGSLIYLFTKPDFVKAVKIPPITPLLPYLPEAFNINWLPPFPFTYWIIAIALVAIFHEGFHGIFMRFYNVRIKSSGFGFLGPFLAFFVEQDEKQLRKAKPFAQQTILAAGVFANILLWILFLVIMALFFNASHTASGVIFQDYTYSAIPIAGLINATITNESFQVDGVNVTRIELNNQTYFASDKHLSNFSGDYLIPIYQDLPALRSGLKGAIIKINDKEIKSNNDIGEITSLLKPGDSINITTEYKENGTYQNPVYEIKLGSDYSNSSRAVIGIDSIAPVQGGPFKKFMGKLMNSFKDPDVYYKAKANEDLTRFIDTLFWWIALINLSVAVANMLPVGIFDGGRFFYLAVLMVTRREKIAAKAFKFMTWLFLFILALSMALWAVGMIF